MPHRVDKSGRVAWTRQCSALRASSCFHKYIRYIIRKLLQITDVNKDFRQCKDIREPSSSVSAVKSPRRARICFASATYCSVSGSFCSTIPEGFFILLRGLSWPPFPTSLLLLISALIVLVSTPTATTSSADKSTKPALRTIPQKELVLSTDKGILV